jgi:uncharacterized tellurite resistance protein B-like protein
MVYCGKGLRAVAPHRDSEPALLDPDRAVRWSQPDREGQMMGYWPFYSAIDPASRAAHLEWLSRGRGPGAYIGYVFLFFYGIERRVLADAAESEQARAEIPALMDEVERLLAIYGGDSSFRGYARSFLSAARIAHRPFKIDELQPPMESFGMEPPLPLRVALGSFAAEGKPVPAEWALSWVLSSPEIRLRTPAQRCPDEFRELFKIRYLDSCEDGGLLVRPNKTTIATYYHPASPTFAGHVSLKIDLPDVAGLAAPVRKLQELADSVLQDLDVYSRWVGRTGDSAGPAALSLLPPELARGRESEESKRIVQWVEESLAGEASAVVRGEELLAQWPVQGQGRFGKRDAEMLASFLARRGYGAEPDVRFGGPVPGAGPAVLFRLPEGPGTGEPSPAYQAAALLLHLAAALSAADGEVTVREERHLLAHLEGALHLSAREKARLKAHLRWLLADAPGLGGLKKRVEPLSEAQRRGIGQFLITVAGADGHVGAEELKLLTKIYGLLGLEAQAVYSDVHALASAEAPPAAEPVTVRPAAPAGGFPIPPAQPPPRAGGISLDLRKVQAKIAETEQVSSLLEGIFREDGTPAPALAAPVAPVGEGMPAPPPGIAGLDAAHSELLRRLAAKTVWPRIEVERLAGELGLLPDGALEVINEAAFERCGAPLLEGDEIIEIDPHILEELTA